MKSKLARHVFVLPLVTAALGLCVLLYWRTQLAESDIHERLPGADQPPGADGAAAVNPILAGKVISGNGQPSNLPGAWPQFRGPDRNGINSDNTAPARSWPAQGPRELWSIDCGEGYAGVAVRDGRVFLMDYDYDRKQNALRCLSLADGKEIWRYAYTMPVKRNHGMTRTVPALAGKFVVAMDPKCNVACLDSATGELRWGINLVREYGATIPPWYAGQCPLIDGQAVVLAVGGPDALLLAVDLESGKPLWRTPNPRDWKMTHSSVMPMDFAGQRTYVYCASGGVVGVAAGSGALLWETGDWKISIATVPSPLIVGDGKIFLSGGYNSGSMMLQLRENGGKIVPEVLFKLAPEVFGATQHTPILYDSHIFGTRPNGQFVCLDLGGKIVWTSPAGSQFGLGPFLIAGGVIFVMDDSGQLSLIDANASHFIPLAHAQVLKGRESWGPMAMAGGRLLVRDFTRLACLNVSGQSE